MRAIQSESDQLASSVPRRACPARSSRSPSWSVGSRRRPSHRVAEPGGAGDVLAAVREGDVHRRPAGEHEDHEHRERRSTSTGITSRGQVSSRVAHRPPDMPNHGAARRRSLCGRQAQQRLDGGPDLVRASATTGAAPGSLLSTYTCTKRPSAAASSRVALEQPDPVDHRRRADLLDDQADVDRLGDSRSRRSSGTTPPRPRRSRAASRMSTPVASDEVVVDGGVDQLEVAARCSCGRRRRVGPAGGDGLARRRSRRGWGGRSLAQRASCRHRITPTRPRAAAG